MKINLFKNFILDDFFSQSKNKTSEKLPKMKYHLFEFSVLMHCIIFLHCGFQLNFYWFDLRKCKYFCIQMKYCFRFDKIKQGDLFLKNVFLWNTPFIKKFYWN